LDLSDRGFKSYKIWGCCLKDSLMTENQQTSARIENDWNSSLRFLPYRSSAKSFTDTLNTVLNLILPLPGKTFE
jgi:hypothetical protein